MPEIGKSSARQLWALLVSMLEAGLVVAALAVPANSAYAQTCNVKGSQSSTPTIAISSNSYCELCGYGYVTIVVSNRYDNNPAHTLSINNLTATLTGVVYEPTAPNSVTYRVNGGGTVAGTVSGTSNLTFTNLPDVPTGSGTSAGTLEVTFAVRRVSDPEGLVLAANRQVSATVNYDLTAATNPTPTQCVNNATASTGTQTITLRQPNPTITKRGWNYDAGQRQGTASDPVYGNNGDDVVWRILIQNTGNAPLQDLRFDDLMETGSMDIRYACPTQASADAVANNNGVPPGGSPCVAASNSINNFIVTNPFGQRVTTTYPWGATYERDISAGGNISVYLVGKIWARVDGKAEDGSCATRKINTVNDVSWGCDAQSPAGGLPLSGTGPTDTATLYTRYMDNGAPALQVNRRLTGVNTAQPVGTRGLMTITIHNNSRGSVKFSEALAYHLRDTLPPEYVMDPTYTPTLAVTSPYGAYPGRVDRITWTNPAPGTFPLNTSDATSYLNNTRPEFKLTSSSTHPRYADQRNMLRQGDRVTITFRVVLIESAFYDRVANLDVTPEVYPGTDPTYQTPLSNTLEVVFDTFCTTQGTQTLTLTGNSTVLPTAANPTNWNNGTTIPANPEDLDVRIDGTTFILTNDPAQQLTLPVSVTNNGGHDARDYHLFVTFGATMDIVSAPAGCSPISLSGTPPQPAPWKVWVNPPGNPIPLPSTATVYHCTSLAAIAPGQTVSYNFDVRKTSDPARIAIDDLTFRADVVGEITVSDGTPLWFPAPVMRPDGQTDRANNYSLDAVWARVIGFNLMKAQVGTCSENNPPIVDTVAGKPVERVEIGEECTYHIDTGGWFGFETPGFAYIAVQNIQVVDESPDGQGYVSSTDPYAASTALIKNVTLNPAGLTAVDEGWFDWRFNVSDADRIEQADEWFRVNVTTRMLNDALNARAAPNRHGANSHNVLNSTFDATFQNKNTGATEKYTLGYSQALGINTVGYPLEPIRRVDVTVTEPLLTMVKEVCNETRYGVGAACSNWTTLASDGDTYDSYIYRITVTNEAASGGLARSPAYDVVVTDTLDTSDLMYVVPFAADGLDNDADITSDGGDADEGAISDNTVLNGTPAVLTFSHTHSTALQRIDPGASVQLYYRVDPDQRIAPMQALTNSASASYDTLEGSTLKPSGNQTVDPRPNGEIGGARVYTSATASATVRMIPPVTYPKRVLRLSDTAIGGTPQAVKVGEEVEFELSADLPVAQLRSFFIQDYLPAGLSCAEAPIVDLSQAPYSAAGFTRPDGSPVPPVTPTCLSDRVIWDFGDVVLTQRPAGAGYFHFTVKFIARVDNSAGNNDGVVLSNGRPATNATLVYVDVLGTTVIQDFGQVDVVVREPRIQLTKSFTPDTNADAGDELTVTVTARNIGNATAYNLRVLEDLTGTNLTFLAGSVGATGPPPNVDTTTLGANRPLFSWTPPNGIAPNAQIEFTFRVRVDDVVQPLEILDNTIQASWTSLPNKNTALNTAGTIGDDGTATGMRIGAVPNAADPLNDYETTATDSVSVPPLTMTKTDLSPTTTPAIGAHKSFQIEIRLPEGTTNNLVVSDNLAAAGVSYVLANNTDFDITYELVGIAAINGVPVSGVPDTATIEAMLTAIPADGTTGTAVWQIGTVETLTENDVAASTQSPVIRINYYARVNNDLVTDSGDALRNAVAVNYDHGETGAQQTLTATTAAVSVVEPVLTATKSVANISNPGGPANGGDTLEYTLTIANTGNATAYDVNIVDTLPIGLQWNSTFGPTATINGAPVTGFVATPANQPTGPLMWGRTNGDDSLDIPAGQSLILVYRVTVFGVGGALSNSVLVDWTSLDGASTYERTGAGCPVVTAPNDYCVGPAVATLPSVDTTTFAKAFDSDTYDVAPLSNASDAVARVGDEITYRLQPTLRGGFTQNLVVHDTLPAGMEFVGIVSINGDTTANYAPPASGAGSNFAYEPITAAQLPAAGQTGALTFTIGDVVNDPFGDPTTDTFEIVYRARVQPDAGIAHVASTTLTNNAALTYTASPLLTGSQTITVRQPVIGVTKTDRSGRPSGVSVTVATEVMNFRLSACNTGQAPAYDLLITDTLPTQLDDTSITAPVVTINGVVATAGVDYTYTPPAGRGGNLVFRIDTGVNPGQCAHIDYDIGFYTDFGANQSWFNSATVNEYWSRPAAPAQKYGPVGPATFVMQNVASTHPPTKVVVSPASNEVTIGEEIVYRITVPGTPFNGAMYDVAISDTLDPNLEYVDATVSGTVLGVTNTSTAGQMNIAIGQIPAWEQAVIDLRVRVRNGTTADAGTLINNSVVYTYADAAGDPTQGGGSDAAPAIRIIEPLVAAAKSVVNVTNPGNAPTAGDIVRYTLTFTASGGAAGDDFANAYDLTITDNLGLGLEHVGNPAVDGGNTIAAPTVVGDGVTTAQTLTWSLAGGTDIDIPEGATVTVTYDVRVLDGVVANQILSNSVVAQWTGLDGASTYERDGTGTPTQNDYFTAPVTATLTVPDNTTLTKVRLSDTFGAGGDVRIGDIIDFELRVRLDEGTHDGLVLADTLPQGLRFEQVVSVNGDTAAPYGAATPFTHADIAAPIVSGDGVSGPTNVTWNIGHVVNAGDNNAANDDFVIVYRARVLNAVLAHQNTTTLTNSARLDYLVSGGTATRTDTESINVLQPALSVSKISLPADGSYIAAGQIVTYTVDIVNGGAAPAYDVVLADVIPAGMRAGAATITMVSTEIGANLPNLAPVYDAGTGIATWNFDSGVADQYTIPPGGTLRIVYEAQADATLGAGLTLINQAQVQLYYSLDDDAVPALGGITGVREVYGPTNSATTTLYTGLPVALAKQNPAVPEAAIGQPFTYRITVPATPATTALHDVRILDDLTASAANLEFVGVAKVSGSQPWTPVNTGTATQLVIEDTTNGIDIPAGEQIAIDITVVLTDTATNVSGLQFANTASYTFNQLSNDPSTQVAGGADTTANMTVVGPDTLVMTKTGPASMAVGTPGTFRLDLQNTGTGGAWNVTVIDRLPNPTPGGMCDAAPTNITAQVFQADGTTAVSPVLAAGSDYTVSFTGTPSCELTLTMVSAATVIGPSERLIIDYQASLDADNVNATPLTNVAGATRWFSADAASSQRRNYLRTLTDGTVGTLDHEDAHTVAVQAAVLALQKTVVNVTTGQDPGTGARPGDRLRYTITIQNTNAIPRADFSLVDELDRLNTPAVFEAGTLTLVTVPAGADTTNTNASGGSKGTGLVDIRNLSINGNETLTVVFEATLAAVIDSGTVVRNQALLTAGGLTVAVSDDPNINGADDPNIPGGEDPTETLIASAPQLQVLKTSQDRSGDPSVLMAGDTLRYTITVKNVGNENAINTVLRDPLPANTSYLAGSTTLNGAPVPDAAPGVSALQGGFLINAPEDPTPGALRADAGATTGNVATITFDVVIDASVVDGTVISNQGFVNGNGAGSAAFPEQPSDDPATTTPDDPTRDVVGNLPLVYTHKTVVLHVDSNANGFVDPGDTLRYTIAITNDGAVAATGVALTDPTPANSTYVANSVALNGIAVPDPAANTSPLIAGMAVSSPDLTPPLPLPGAGVLSPGTTAVVTFDVTVDASALALPVPLISNQGSVATNELPTQPTDADGVPANGYQPTVIGVGNAQLVTITKEVSVVGGGALQAGGQLEYVVRATNAGTVPVTDVVITDDLGSIGADPLVAGSATLNGLTAGISYAAPVLTADYSATYGALAPGATAVLRFRVNVSAGLAIGSTVINTAQVAWNTPAETDIASVSIDVGGVPGSAILNGRVWHDDTANQNVAPPGGENRYDAGEQGLGGWTVHLLRNGSLLHTTTTSADGTYQFSGLAPNSTTTDQYELQFRAPGAGPSTAMLGLAHSQFSGASPAYVDGWQQISQIVVASGSNVQDLNLPIVPNGVVYDSVLRTPVAGARLALLTGVGSPVDASCFNGPQQQNQVTLASGYYKFDLNFSDPSCPAGGDYLIEVTAPAAGYVAAPSVIIPPTTGATTAALAVPSCAGSADDALPATDYCEAQISPVAPAAAVPARSAGTRYFLHVTLGDGQTPQHSQVFNNHIPIDPELDAAIAIRKTTSLVNVTRGQLVPYTITVRNTLTESLTDLAIVDRLPPGFKYVEGSAQYNGVKTEPMKAGREVRWENVTLIPSETHTIKLLLIVGAGVGEGDYVNQAQVVSNLAGQNASGVATATVRVVPDPTFDCSDIIGKVFDDANANGYQDDGEVGLPGARVVSARGLIARTDAHGRFHITCAAIPDADRGGNFILKLDDRSLPSGYRLTTENPRVERLTRGKMAKFNFGATIHRVVRLDVADGVFEPGSTQMRPQWVPRLDLLIEELRKGPAILRLSYLADVEAESLVAARVAALKREIAERWTRREDAYVLETETEIFWRRGGPPRGARD